MTTAATLSDIFFSGIGVFSEHAPAVNCLDLNPPPPLPLAHSCGGVSNRCGRCRTCVGHPPTASFLLTPRCNPASALRGSLDIKGSARPRGEGVPVETWTLDRTLERLPRVRGCGQSTLRIFFSLGGGVPSQSDR